MRNEGPLGGSTQHHSTRSGGRLPGFPADSAPPRPCDLEHDPTSCDGVFVCKVGAELRIRPGDTLSCLRGAWSTVSDG